MSATDYGPQTQLILQEAKKLKADDPALWRSYEKTLQSYFDTYDEMVSEWRKRSTPPRPDLRVLNLSLVFLVEHAYRKNEGLSWADCEAIVETKDPRKVDVLLEYSRSHPDDDAGYFLAEVISLKLASAEIRTALGKNPALSYRNLIYYLGNRFAEDLPSDLQKHLFTHFSTKLKTAPEDSEGEKYWTLMLRLRPDEGARRLLAFFDKEPWSYTSLLALNALKKPPSLVVPSLLRFLKKRNDKFEKQMAWEIVLKADPQNAWPQYEKELDSFLKKILASQKQEINWYGESTDIREVVMIMLKTDDPNVSTKIEPWIFDKQFEELDRLEFLMYVIQHEHIESDVLVKKWLKEEAPEWRAVLTKFLEERKKPAPGR